METGGTKFIDLFAPPKCPDPSVALSSSPLHTIYSSKDSLEV